MRSLTLLALLSSLTACSNPSGAGAGVAGGAMELRLIDAPADQVTSIVVTVLSVTAHTDAGWVTLAQNRATVDLLQLQNGVFASLGVVALPAGKVTQIRLITDEAGPNYVVTPDGVQHPLTVPSGPQSGIKLKLGFELPACASGAITLDFDGKKSIFTHPTGHDDEWILRPVVRLKSVEASAGPCDAGAPNAPPAGDDGSPTSVDPGPSSTPPISSSGGDAAGCGAGAACADGQYCLNGVCSTDTTTIL